IGNYSEASFNAAGIGTLKANENANPYVGEQGKRHEENEIKIEVIFPSYLKQKIINVLIESHPYEEVAYDIIALSNEFNNTGSGLIGELEMELSEEKFLSFLKDAFNLKVIKHTKLLDKPVKKIAVCGGAGSFLIEKASALNADVYVTSDIKYHEFFDANERVLIADIGHWESEQFTIDLLHDFLRANFPNFAVLKTGKNTNPVYYFI
ncbi:MAG TPA: Nif3-like dinuclear metal center hexameric protein, partial [Parafilimonas sp.]|nr:Nif3-like dinuclear metal center hexameric protein [Parafilimonas sp.]